VLSCILLYTISYTNATHRDNLVEASDTLSSDRSTGRREKRKQEIRNRIQDAAYALFRDHGIKDTSIEQICTAADVARRTFYGYYPDKQALLRELSSSRVRANAEGIMERIMDEHQRTFDRVSAIIDYIEANIAEYTDIDRKLILVGPASDDESNHLRDISYSLQDQFRDVFQAGIDNRDLSGRFSADILSEMVMGTFNNIMMQWALEPSFPIFEKLEQARDLFKHILSET
jgi:AcrR family transcriptional regulator